MVILAGAGLVFVGAEGWLPGSLPVPEVLLAPAAVALALSTGLGMAAFEVDLPDYHFGWRQIASLLAGAALLLAVLPGHRRGLVRPVGHADGRLRAADPQPQRQERRRRSRTACCGSGDADLLPAAGWPLDAPQVDDLGPGALLSYATSNDGMPDVSDVIAGSDAGATSHLAETLQYAAEGGTSRLGALLAPMGIRYIVVPEADAPSPLETGPTVVPEQLLTVLDGQLDLSNLDVAGGVVVYRNAAWGPTRAQLPADTAFPSGDGPPVGAGRPRARRRADRPARRPGLPVVRRLDRRGRHRLPGRVVVGPVAPAGRRPHRRSPGGARLVERLLGAGRERRPRSPSTRRSAAP